MSGTPFKAPSIEKMEELMPSFEFESQIASTEYAAVYLATQKSLDRHVAIRMYSPEMSSNPAFKVAFERAARSMAKFNHANLIAVFSSAEIEGMAFMVMEFVPGKSLIAYCKDHKLPLREAAAIVKGIAAGVAYAHDREILHGGLSIDNILLNKKLEPKIGSFGFMIDTGDYEFERFSAPELAQSSSIITPQADVYSLGVILYELVSGVEYGPNAEPLSSFPGVKPKLDQIWKKATATDPAKRYQTAKEFRDELRKIVPDGQGAASRLMATGKKGAAATSQKPVSVVRAPMPSVGGGSFKLFRNIVIIVLLLFAIKLAWNQKKSREAAMNAQPEEEEVIKARVIETAKAKARRLELARKARLAEEQRNRKEKPPEIVVVPKPEVVVVPKDALGSLSRLRNKLLAGDRLEMPDGSMRMADCDFLYIDKPMTWAEASKFAEEHGAHIAIPNLDATMSWLSKNFLTDSNQGVWLGAAKSGHSEWTRADGLRWAPTTPPAGDGSYLAADASGAFFTLGDNDSRPFIIQWHRNGSNPGSLESVLAKTKITLSSIDPVYPAGAKAYGARHYLYVPRAVTWDKAVKIAQLGGGHLVVPSGVAERFNLKKFMRLLNPENGIWFGGAYDGSQWTWVTKEPWKPGKWAKGVDINQKNSALKVMADYGWVPQDRNQLASGLLIEWSGDAK